jgi:hypothetical protein
VVRRVDTQCQSPTAGSMHNVGLESAGRLGHRYNMGSYQPYS